MTSFTLFRPPTVDRKHPPEGALLRLDVAAMRLRAREAQVRGFAPWLLWEVR